MKEIRLFAHFVSHIYYTNTYERRRKNKTHIHNYTLINKNLEIEDIHMHKGNDQR